MRAILLLLAPNTPALAQTAQPNESAIALHAPAPGLDNGFVPQGLTILDGAVLLAGYLWPLPGPNTCRIWNKAKAPFPFIYSLDVARLRP